MGTIRGCAAPFSAALRAVQSEGLRLAVSVLALILTEFHGLSTGGGAPFFCRAGGCILASS